MNEVMLLAATGASPEVIQILINGKNTETAMILTGLGCIIISFAIGMYVVCKEK